MREHRPIHSLGGAIAVGGLLAAYVAVSYVILTTPAEPHEALVSKSLRAVPAAWRPGAPPPEGPAFGRAGDGLSPYIWRVHDAPKGWSYPWSCCSNQDCREVTGGGAGAFIAERPEGYVVRSTGEVIGYADKRIKNSPDGEYHWCAHQAGLDAGHTICLFVPPKGF